MDWRGVQHMPPHHLPFPLHRVGIVLFFVGFPLLAWNENNYIRVRLSGASQPFLPRPQWHASPQVWESLAEGLQKVESVPDVNYLDNSLSGNLVHIAGPLSNVPVLRDECVRPDS